MKILFSILLFSISFSLFSGTVVIYDPSDPIVPNRVISRKPSVSTDKWLGTPNMLINPDESGLTGHYTTWKYNGSILVNMSGAELTAIANANATAQDTSLRTGAKDGFDGQTITGLQYRALAEVILDELNTLRALHSLPDRTLGQAKTAIQNKIDNGDVDE